ncbi:hypothetical protein AAVH_16397 [Aphelenchoides avenae]|nr:hypothetical protein AAVH_16397 [Aphelenchus avenae]
MDAQGSLLDDTEVHFVIDCITAACAQKSTDVSMQAWLLNQQVHEVILNGANVEDASLNGLMSKELLQRLGDVANVTLGRMSEGFSAAIK